MSKPEISKITVTFSDGTVKEMTLESLAKINDLTDFSLEVGIVLLRLMRIARSGLSYDTIR